jgi:phosphoglycolate phosphatase-like HAD superfamily hydrolase
MHLPHGSDGPAAATAGAGEGLAAAQSHGVFSLGAYDQLVFDCDGVVVDTNDVKASNIRKAALSVCDPEDADRFVAYFIENNGLPRETKIAAFFDDPEAQRTVLAAYNRLNAATVPFVEPDPVTRSFLERCNVPGVPLYLLSGGDEQEVRLLLDNAGIAPLFREILGAPSTKVEHLERLKLNGRTCYFGDSRYDYEVATRFGFDFVFLSRYTQFGEWREFFASRPEVRVVVDFRAFVPQAKGAS